MRLKDKKGSISIFVLVALLFMSAFLVISFASNANKSKTVKEQFNIISGIYAYGGGEEGAYNKAYTDLREKNKQTMTAAVENSSTLELTKTYAENKSNLRIYGNSVQDGIPTPKSPVDIYSVGEIINLFNKNNVLSNTIIKEDGTLGEGKGYSTGEFIKIEYNQKYYCSKTGSLRAKFYNSDKEPLTTDTYSDTYIEKGGFFTNVNEEAYYIRFTVMDENLDTLILAKSETEMDYVPYGRCKIPVKVSQKNLFNYSLMSEEATERGVTLSRDRDVFKLNGECIEKYAIKSKEFNLNEGTYTITIKKLKGSFNNSLRVYLYQQGGALIKSTVMKQDSTTATVTINDELAKGNQYISIYMSAGDSFDNCEFIIQIEKGINSTEYQLYQDSQIFNIYLDEPLRKVGNYTDYIDFDSQKIVRQVGKQVFNGSEYWVTTSDVLANTFIGFAVKSSTYNIRTGPNNECISDRFSYSTNNSINICRIDSSSEYGMRIIAGMDIAPNMTVAEFKEWLSRNNTTICYPLQTPVETIIDVPEFQTYEDYTKIEVLTDVAPSKIEAEYVGYTLD